MDTTKVSKQNKSLIIFFVVFCFAALIVLFAITLATAKKASAAPMIVSNTITVEKPCPEENPLCFKVNLPMVVKPLPSPCEKPVVETFRAGTAIQTVIVRFKVKECPGVLDVTSSQPDLAHHIDYYPTLIVWENPNNAWWWLDDEIAPPCDGGWTHYIKVWNDKPETVSLKITSYGNVVWEGHFNVWTEDPPNGEIPPNTCGIPLSVQE